MSACGTKYVDLVTLGVNSPTPGPHPPYAAWESHHHAATILADIAHALAAFGVERHGTDDDVAGRDDRPRGRHQAAGSGPGVRGPMLSLLLAATGRKAALDELAGEGVAVLRSRA